MDPNYGRGGYACRKRWAEKQRKERTEKGEISVGVKVEVVGAVAARGPNWTRVKARRSETEVRGALCCSVL